ncbi:hypothetical protein HK104_000706 [Borealophlyctis nickersoniae]|nr:hypothetical protein HK104_000706 [Borealophlyctis nickersoniae]
MVRGKKAAKGKSIFKLFFASPSPPSTPESPDAVVKQEELTLPNESAPVDIEIKREGGSGKQADSLGGDNVPKPRLRVDPDALFPSLLTSATTSSDNHDVWRLFTKVKEALPNGARVENLTWRLMHLRKVKEEKRAKDAERKGEDPSDKGESTKRDPKEDTVMTDMAVEASRPRPIPPNRSVQSASQHIPMETSDAIITRRPAADITDQQTMSAPVSTFDMTLGGLRGSGGEEDTWLEQFITLEPDKNDVAAAFVASATGSSSSEQVQSEEPVPDLSSPTASEVSSASEGEITSPGKDVPESQPATKSAAPSKHIAPSQTKSGTATSNKPQSKRALANSICSNCGATKTSLWRRDMAGQVLCNACGLFFKLHGVMRPISMKSDVIRKRQRSKGTVGGKMKGRAGGWTVEREKKGGTAPVLIRSMSSPNMASMAQLPSHSLPLVLPRVAPKAPLAPGPPLSQLTASLAAAGPYPQFPGPAFGTPSEALASSTPIIDSRQPITIPLQLYDGTPPSLPGSSSGSWAVGSWETSTSTNASASSCLASNSMPNSMPNSAPNSVPNSFHYMSNSLPGVSLVPLVGSAPDAAGYTPSSRGWPSERQAAKRMRTSHDGALPVESSVYPLPTSMTSRPIASTGGSNSNNALPNFDMGQLLQQLLEFQAQQLQTGQVQQNPSIASTFDASFGPTPMKVEPHYFPMDQQPATFQHITVPADRPIATPSGIHSPPIRRLDAASNMDTSMFGDVRNIDLLTMIGSDPAGALTEDFVDGRWGGYGTVL